MCDLAFGTPRTSSLKRLSLSLSFLSSHPPQPQPSQRKFIFQASKIWQRHRPLVSLACVCCERISGFLDPSLDSCRFFQNTKKRVHPVGSFLNFLTISGVRDVLFEIVRRQESRMQALGDSDRAATVELRLRTWSPAHEIVERETFTICPVHRSSSKPVRQCTP